MSDTNNKITVRFESTGEITDNSTPNFLLSGPVEIFATLDSFNELTSEELKTEVLSDNSNRTIIVYVKDVRGKLSNENDQTHRGAYFVYVGQAEDGSLQWQEILLGTHSHKNIDALEAWTELLATANIPEDGRLIKILPGGKFEFVDISDKVLPELPYDVKQAIAQNQKVNVNQPETNEAHHLDASLSELNDTYDWARENPDGTYKNTAIGTCYDVYRELMRMKRKLYVRPTSDKGIEFTEAGETSDPWILLFKNNPADADSLKTEDYDKYRLRLTLALDSTNYLYTNDQILIYDGETLLTDQWMLESIDNVKHTINILIKKSYYESKDHSDLTVLVIRGGDSKTKDTVLAMLEEGEETLESINDKLTKLAVESKLFDDAISPTYYLTINEKGEYVWSNPVLPNTFYWRKTVPLELAELDSTIEKEFKEVYGYDPEKDTPIVMIDQFFVPNADVVAEAGNKIKVRVPYNSIYSQLKGDGAATLTVLIVRNSAGRSVAEDLAANYVSKKDAVEILSRGKINLDDYVKKSELRDFSHIGHTHTQYATLDHNHDFRYANFHHTHPEIALTIAALLNGSLSAEDINKKFEEIQKKDEEAIKAALKEAGIDVDENGNLVINPDKLDLNYQELIKQVNNKVQDAIDSGTVKDVHLLETGANLEDILLKIIELFGYDIVNDSQVVLETDLPVKNKVGGIKVDKYLKNTTLQTILRDMLNPFLSAEENKELMRPDKDKSKVLYYVKTDNGFVEVDLSNLKPEYMNKQLYYKVDLKNKNGDDCKSYYINSQGSEVEQRISYTLPGISDNGFYTVPEDGILIKVSSGRVYDNYGLDSTDGLDIILEFEVPEKQPDYPDFYYGIGDAETNDLIPVYLKENHELTFEPAAGEYIILLVEAAYQPVILDKFFGDITDVFEIGSTESHGSLYRRYTYRVLADNSKINLNIELK